MTEFRTEPVKEVIVNELIQEDIENFLHQSRIGGAISAMWVDGIIIALLTASLTESHAKKFLDGTRIYEKVIFVKYPKYTKSVKWNGGNYELALRNYKNNPRFVRFAKWIKSQSVWNVPLEVSS